MFAKGYDPKRNMGGRPKKARNKTTVEIQNALTKILEGEVEYVGEVLSNLRLTDPKEYLKFTLKMSEFILPRRSTINANIEGEIGVKLNKIEVQILNNEIKNKDDESI